MAIYLFLQEVSLQGYLLKTNMQKKTKTKTNKQTKTLEIMKCPKMENWLMLAQVLPKPEAMIT